MVSKKIYATDEFLKDPVRWEKLLHVVPESEWVRRGKRMAFGLWSDVRMSVPAYVSYLSLHRVQKNMITSMKHWARIPISNKDSYLRKYPLPKLMPHGPLARHQLTIAATSGSTGDPFYFPRTRIQDMQYAAIAEMYLRSNFSIRTKSTLYIVGWGMGVWIGGVFSFEAIRIVAERGCYPLSVITPGSSQEEILRAVASLGHLYDQIIIGGYPPMIKDLVDEGNRRRIPWEKFHVKFIFSAEGFSESFRDYIIKNAGLQNAYLDTLNHYGTVDLGTMAHETPLSILIRRIALKLPSLNEALFHDRYRQPTLAQYIPELYYFEEISGGLVCTAKSGIPLVRYDLMDTGGIWSLHDIRRICKEYGVDIDHEVKNAGISSTIWNLPFVYVFERKDFTIKVYGANIFPEEIRKALEDGAFSRILTGKHTAEVSYDGQMTQKWTVHLEMKKGTRITDKLKLRLQQIIVDRLVAENSEFSNNVKSVGRVRMTPDIMCWPWKSAPYFSSSGKHHWVRKT